MNIDLTKILKDCPKGTKLYSTIYGEVEVAILDDDKYPIGVFCPTATQGIITPICRLSKDGKYNNQFNGECTLFPSKDQRDWNKFTAPWYKKEKLVKLKENDEKIRRWIIDDIRYNMNNEPLNNSEYKKKAKKAIAWLEKQREQNLPSTNERAWLYLVSDVLTWKDGIGQYLDDPRVQELAKRLCREYAQKLYNPSVLSNSSNTGKNEQKFDPKTLQPFDKVLVRDGSFPWRCDIFSYYQRNKRITCHCTSDDYIYDRCIPYNEETKHLVGTTEGAPEFYRYWED